MEMHEKNQPTSDERVNQVLQGLSIGTTRDELAGEFGHKNYKTLDIYMRRKNFTWDKDNQTYIQKRSKSEDNELKSISVPYKVDKILHLLKEEGCDVKECAKKAGFQDQKELASYMASQSYTWDTEKVCYVKNGSSIVDKVVQKKERVIEMNAGIHQEQPSLEGVDRYIPLLRMLEENHEQLEELLTNKLSSSGQIPTFTIPGVSGTKTVQMINSLNVLIQEFSEQKNISQRRVFEVALIEFFQKYGFKREIDSLLRSR